MPSEASQYIIVERITCGDSLWEVGVLVQLSSRSFVLELYIWVLLSGDAGEHGYELIRRAEFAKSMHSLLKDCLICIGVVF